MPVFLLFIISQQRPNALPNWATRAYVGYASCYRLGLHAQQHCVCWLNYYIALWPDVCEIDICQGPGSANTMYTLLCLHVWPTQIWAGVTKKPENGVRGLLAKSYMSLQSAPSDPPCSGDARGGKFKSVQKTQNIRLSDSTGYLFQTGQPHICLQQVV